MDDYIKRGALMDAIENLDWYQPVGKGRLSGGASSEKNAVYKATDIFRVVKDVPIVDAVPVVRCKDCKYFSRDAEFNRAWCNYNEWALETAVNGYCFRGERRDNG